MATAAHGGGGAKKIRRTTGQRSSTMNAAATQAIPDLCTLRDRLVGARFRRACERVHRLGPRVVGELLTEAGVALERVEIYAAMDRYPAGFMRDIGADTWAPSVFAVAAST